MVMLAVVEKAEPADVPFSHCRGRGSEPRPCPAEESLVLNDADSLASRGTHAVWGRCSPVDHQVFSRDRAGQAVARGCS